MNKNKLLLKLISIILIQGFLCMSINVIPVEAGNHNDKSYENSAYLRPVMKYANDAIKGGMGDTEQDILLEVSYMVYNFIKNKKGLHEIKKNMLEKSIFFDHWNVRKKITSPLQIIQDKDALYILYGNDVVIIKNNHLEIISKESFNRNESETITEEDSIFIYPKVWNTFYSAEEIEHFLLNPDIPKNQYRFWASIAFLPEDKIGEEFSKLRAIGLILLNKEPNNSHIKASSYMPWMELDNFVEESEKYEFTFALLEKLAILNNFIIKNDVNILAHGVSMNKGGIEGFLDVMLEGRIRKDTSDGKTYFGMIEKLTNYAPFYIIVDEVNMKRDGILRKKGDNYYCKGDLHEDYHKYYLVPSQKERKILIRALGEAKGLLINTLDQKVVIESDYINSVISKIKTYEEFQKIIDTKNKIPVINKNIRQGV